MAKYRTLNLAQPTISDIKFSVQRFPDGQQDIRIDPITEPCYVRIKSRMQSFRDVELILAADAALENFDAVQDVDLFLPYMLGARSDRKFVEGGTEYFRQVLAPVLATRLVRQIIVLDPHSDAVKSALEAVAVPVVVLDHKPFVQWALEKFQLQPEEVTLLNVDHGATRRNAVLHDIPFKEVINCEKTRTMEDGAIQQLIFPDGVSFVGKKVLIVDDICDGGRSFVLAGQQVRRTGAPDCKLFLAVTHGIFSQGFLKLNDVFLPIRAGEPTAGLYNKDSTRYTVPAIATTNSYSEQIPKHAQSMDVFGAFSDDK